MNDILEQAFDEDFDAAGSVIICPGGGYSFLSLREAEPVARRFREQRWRPYILRYSTPYGVAPPTTFIRPSIAGAITPFWELMYSITT